MPTFNVIKDPDANLDYGIDWADWLDGDTIATSVWAEEGTSDLTLTNDTNTDTTATVYVAGGTAGTEYTLRNRITTGGGRTDDRSILIKVQDK